MMLVVFFFIEFININNKVKVSYVIKLELFFRVVRFLWYFE